MTNEVRPTSNAGNWHTRTVNLMLLLFPKDQKADVAQRLVEPLYAVRLDHALADLTAAGGCRAFSPSPITVRAAWAACRAPGLLCTTATSSLAVLGRRA